MFIRTSPPLREGTRDRVAFTLVELLVVIAIISLLAGLLLPALSAALNAARTISCLNGTKNVAMGVRDYQTDFDGWVPKGATYYWSDYAGGGVQATLVDNNYCIEALFCNQGGCPDGPENYKSSSSKPQTTNPPGKVAYGVNYILQMGNGRHEGTSKVYGRLRDGDARLRQRPGLVMLTSCSVAPAADDYGCRRALGIGVSDAYSQYFRHDGEKLPLTFYDLHGKVTSREEWLPHLYNDMPKDHWRRWSLIQLYWDAGKDGGPRTPRERADW